jgi:hypothetical protein
MVLEPFHFQDNPQNGENAREGDRVYTTPQPNPRDEAWRLH